MQRLRRIAQAIWLLAAVTLPDVAGAAQVDLLVLYTPGGTARYTDKRGVETRIQNLVAISNQIYIDSFVDIQLRVVHMQEVSYSDTASSETALVDLTFNRDAAFANVRTLQAQYGADMIVMMRPYANDGVCGIAWVGGAGSNGQMDAVDAFYSVSHVSLNCSGYVTAHELGHNMGLWHSRRQDGVGATFEYSLGHGVDGSFVTVMAYEAAYSAPKVYKFSSPGLVCKGQPCGVPVVLPGRSADAMTSLNAVRAQVSAYRTQVSAPRNARAGDFDGDGKADILYENETDRTFEIALQDGLVTTRRDPISRGLALRYRVAGIGDFDGDGKDDIFFRDQSSGDHQVWLMDGASATARLVMPLPYADWTLEQTGDFDADGRDDLYWRHRDGGANHIWGMNGSSLTALTGVSLWIEPAWNLTAIADFDGDGTDDLYWHHDDGYQLILLMDDRMPKAGSAQLTGRPPTVRPEAAGDFDGDGKADLLFRNQNNGVVDVWLLDGARVASTGTVGALTSPSWAISGTGDYDGDGKDDILWYNAVTEESAIWFMNGTTLVSQGTTTGP